MAIIPKINHYVKQRPQESRIVYMLLVSILIFVVYESFSQKFFALVIFFLGGILGKWLGTSNPFTKEEVWVNLGDVKDGSNKNAKK